jgi:hypothetical protein
MNNRKRGIIFTIIITLLLLVLGYWRDHLFVNLNYQAYKVAIDPSVEFTLPHDLSWLGNLSYSTLYWLKFPFTLFFSLLYYLIAFITIRRFFPGRRFQRLNSLIYGITFLVSLFIFSIGYFIGRYETFYSISRYIMGFLQSPLLLMLVVIAFRVAGLMPAEPKKDAPEILDSEP